jgi:glycosyltransferase involved in cell wall biosynthesis
MVDRIHDSERYHAGRPTLLVFADDWGRHPSSCQHIVRRLRDHCAVNWINTIGTRSPKLNLATISRGWEKLKQWGHRSKDDSNSRNQIRVLNPRMWPSFRTRFSRQLNRQLLLRQLSSLTKTELPPIVAVTTLPIVADLVGRLNADRWVYYCVDDFSVWPGLDHKILDLMERQLVSQVDEIIVVSDVLGRRINSMGRSCQLLTHGVDLQHWSGCHQNAAPLPASLALPNEPPWIVFWGVVDRRLDVDYLLKLSNEMVSGTIVLAGPEDNPDPRLLASPRIARLGAVAYELLPQLAASSSALIMPYADLAVTRAMQPLKLKEYLATGKPVVTSDLPACREWSDCCDLARTPAEFSTIVRFRMNSPIPTSQSTARSRLAHETWDRKAATFERILFGEYLRNADQHQNSIPCVK